MSIGERCYDVTPCYGQHLPPGQHPPGKQADGTPPTGMLSCSVATPERATELGHIAQPNPTTRVYPTSGVETTSEVGTHLTGMLSCT